jgi:hypothetical protein
MVRSHLPPAASPLRTRPLAFERGAAAVALDVHLEDGGVMNQAVDDRDRHCLVWEDLKILREAVAQWGQAADLDEATTQPLRRLPCDATYQRAGAYLRRVMDELVFTRPGQEPGDRR